MQIVAQVSSDMCMWLDGGFFVGCAVGQLVMCDAVLAVSGWGWLLSTAVGQLVILACLQARPTWHMRAAVESSPGCPIEMHTLACGHAPQPALAKLHIHLVL